MNVFLKNKAYRRFSIASFLSSAGDILFYLALMTYASKLKNYSLALSLIAISESLPRLFDIFGGYLADRTQKKLKNIFLMSVIRFILYILVGLLFVTNIAQWNLVIAVILINFISDTIGAYAGGLGAPLIVDLVSQKDFAEAEGFTNGISQIITTVAQFIGSGLLLFLSYSSLAFVNAFTFLFAGLLYASVGLRYKKDKKPLERQEINNQKLFVTLRTSYNQMRQAPGLLSIIFVIALLNGALSAMSALLPIIIAGNRTTMIIFNYSFTIAIIGVVVSLGAILGSILGPLLFKKKTIFLTVLVAIALSVATTLSALLANIFATLSTYFLLSFAASLTSLKMQQWLVTTIEHKILASSVGLINTILMAIAPLMTTGLTTISGLSSVKYALIVLLATEIIIFFVALKMKPTNKLTNKKVVKSAVTVNE